jgi:osmotically-inducible protein OsmY
VRRFVASVLLLALTACTATTTERRKIDFRFTSPPIIAFKDTLLVAAVRTKLLADDIDSTTRIHVAVKDGNVTLSGRVPTVAVKTRAVASTRSVRGVKSVSDEMAVGNAGPSLSQSADDVGVEAAVESALLAQTGINVTGIKVTTKDGVVTLTGHAPTAAIKATMLEAAQKAPGARNVVDHIAVK